MLPRAYREKGHATPIASIDGEINSVTSITWTFRLL